MNGVLTTNGARNNFDLFVKPGSEPTTTDFVCADTCDSAVGACEIAAPSPGPWQVLAHRVSGTGAVQLTATLFGGAAPGGCVGDCNDSGAVTIDEIIRGVRIVLGGAAVSDCPAFDSHGTGVVEVTAIVQAVNAALGGCPR